MSNLSDLINKDDDYSYNYPGDASKIKEEESLETDTEGYIPGAEAAAAANDTAKVAQEVILASFEKIKTHFPAARIKKIMQSDDEIGKVAQATPIIVGRALEIFMANLVEASIIEAKRQGVKRISASHIRAAVENTEQFDFLVDAVEKYPPVK